MTSNTTVDVLHPYPVGDLITIGEAATQFNGRGSLLKIKFLPVVNFAGNLVQLGDSLTYLSNTEEEGSGVLAPRTRAVNEFLEPVRDKIAELLVGPYIKYVTTVHQTEPGTWGPSANRKFFNLITSSSRNLQLTLSLEKYLNTSISGKSIGDPITSGTLNFQLEFDKIGLTRENIKFRFTKYISTLILKVLVLRATLANNYDAAFQLTESTTLNFSTLFELVSSPGMLGGLSDVSVFNGVYSATHEFAREASAIVWGERDDEVLRQERGRCVGSKTKRPNLYLPSSYFVPIPEDNVGQCVYIALAWQLLLQYVQRYSTKRINPDARHLIQLKTKDGEPYHDTVWSVLELLQPVRFPPLRMLETHIAPDNAGTPHSIHKEWCKPEIDFIVDWLVREFMPERPCWLKLEHVETLVERINVKMEVYKRSVNVFMISGIREERLGARSTREIKVPNYTFPRLKEERQRYKDNQVLDCVLVYIHNHVHLVRTFSVNAALFFYDRARPVLPAKRSDKYKYCRVCHVTDLGKGHSKTHSCIGMGAKDLDINTERKRRRCKSCESQFCLDGIGVWNVPANTWFTCSDCNGRFFSQQCYNLHISEKTCRKYVWCWQGERCIMYKKALGGSRMHRKQYFNRKKSGDNENENESGDDEDVVVDFDDNATAGNVSWSGAGKNSLWKKHQCDDIICANCGDTTKMVYFPALFKYNHKCLWKQKQAKVPYPACSTEECGEPSMYFEKAVLPDPTRGQYGPFFNDRRHPEFRKKQHDFRINKSKPKVCDTGYCEEHKLELTDPVLVRQHRIAVYDFETMQENWVEKIDSDGKKTKEYRPFTVNAVAMSHLYADEGQDEPFTRYWCGENALTEFVEFIRTRPSDVRGGGLYYRGWQFLAHNGSRFDTCFIRKYCISNNIPTAGLETGRKIRSLALSLTNIKPGPDNGNNSVSTHRIGDSHVTDTCWSMTVTFVDSMDFIATGLAKFPKMFGLKCDAKGYFPHQLNTRDHQNVKMSTLPDIKYYGLDDMSPSYAMDVETWHRKNRFTSRFDLQEEMKRYCINDVVILREGVKVFIDAFVKLGRVHPLGNLTIAGACMSAYESTYLPKEITIEHTRPKPVVQTSKEAVTFFSGLNQMIITGMSPTVCYFNNGHDEVTGCKGWGYGIPLNADLYRNARYEYRVTVGERTFIADCYLPAADGESGPGTIIEFNGCYWHGCRDCNIHVYNEGKGEHERRYVNTLEKEMTIRAEGFEFIPVWACKARKFIQYWTQNNITDMVGPTLRIDPRESMAGGRTEPFASLVEVAGNGRCTLHYVDFTSLYPYVNAFKEYPCGPMTTLVNRERGKYYDPAVENLKVVDHGLHAYDLAESDWIGFAMVKVLPPKDLLIPVLPYKSNRPKKLFFGLCAACMLRAAKFDPDVEMFQDGDSINDHLTRAGMADIERETLFEPCNHTDEERSWIETYTSVDIKLALEYGYEFPNVYEINMYEGRSTELFKDYMSSAIQMKIKASKPPAGTREEQEEILDWYRDEMGMTDLSLDDIELNEGMRNTSKIIVNSLWGKFGQRAEYPDKKLFTSYEEFAEHRERYPDKKMVDFRFWEEVSDVMEARFKTDRANIVKHSTFYQPQLAAFTTSHGRDVLYRDGIAKLHPTQIVYCDTDSIVCIYDRDNPNHKEPFCPEVYGSGDGFILGTMKDELEGKVMKRFYSLAPKTYAYEKEITAKDKAKVDACQDENTKKRLRSMFTEEIKSKGFSLSRGCVEGEGFNVDSFKEMVLGNLEEIKTHVEAGLYRSMDLGEPRVRSETKVLKRPEFIKRKLLPMENHKNYSILRSVPWGYVEQ